MKDLIDLINEVANRERVIKTVGKVASPILKCLFKDVLKKAYEEGKEGFVEISILPGMESMVKTCFPGAGIFGKNAYIPYSALQELFRK